MEEEEEVLSAGWGRLYLSGECAAVPPPTTEMPTTTTTPADDCLERYKSQCMRLQSETFASVRLLTFFHFT